MVAGMIKLEELMAATLPADIVYSGKATVAKNMRRLTVTGFGNMNIGPLSETGSISVKTSKGFLWILDALIHYDLVAGPVEADTDTPSDMAGALAGVP
jgi:hypothetical protein